MPKRGTYVEIYRVEQVRNSDACSFQVLDLIGVNKKASLKWRGFRVYRIEPKFNVGNILNLYTTDDKNRRIFKACSYKIDGNSFVDIQIKPETQYQVEHFYDDMPKFEALRLRYEVVCALRAQKIEPTFNSANNLRLLLFNPVALGKTL